jgi:hypothetical protein
MKFRVGSSHYRVHISDGQLIDRDLGPVSGLCCREERRIWLSGTLPLEDRIDTLFHELVHAWASHLPIPGQEEKLADWVACFTLDAWSQFERQGGAQALMRLRPDGIIHDEALADLPNPRPSAAWAVECPAHCGPIAIGSAQSHAARWEAEFDRLVIDREVYCERCDLTILWTESATTAGKPSGRVLAPATVRRGGSPALAF